MFLARQQVLVSMVAFTCRVMVEVACASMEKPIKYSHHFSSS